MSRPQTEAEKRLTRVLLDAAQSGPPGVIDFEFMARQAFRALRKLTQEMREAGTNEFMRFSVEVRDADVSYKHIERAFNAMIDAASPPYTS